MRLARIEDQHGLGLGILADAAAAELRAAALGHGNHQFVMHMRRELVRREVGAHHQETLDIGVRPHVTPVVRVASRQGP